MSRFICTIGILLLTFLAAEAKIIKIPADYPKIQAGIDAAAKGDTVLVAEGTYYENINFKGKAIKVGSLFLIDSDTTHINKTIINGSKPTDPTKGSVVSFTSGEDTTSVICGFKITGGTGTLYDAKDRVGGGIYCKTSGARIVHNKILFNTVNHTNACQGGGIGYWPQTNSIARYVIIEDNIIESNAIISSNSQSYLNGGGIHIVKGRVTGNTIRYNSVSGQPIFAGGGGISATCENTAASTLAIIFGNTITHNQAKTPGYYGGWGAGVDVARCNVQIMDNTIAYNTAGGSRGKGAGIRLWGSQASSIIKNNTISFNSVTAPGAGGGIELDQTEGVQVVANRIEGNNGSFGGGGIDESRCTLAGNLINGNFIKSNIGGKQGGGIWAMNAKITNNFIVENEARRGGGIFYYYHPSFGSKVAQIINNTLTKNIADTAGSIAIYKANVVVMNTICWGNTATHGSEIQMWGGTLNTAHSDIRFGKNGITIDSVATVNWLAGNIDVNPLFTIPQYQLSNSSPCIGAGSEGLQINGMWYSCPTTDFEGNPRPNPEGSFPDIGAYENSLDKPSGPILVPEQYASIQAGINAARDGGLVLVKDGTYYENINFKGKAITVASYYWMDGDTTHINNTIIDGSKPSHADSGSVVYFVSGEDTTSVLCGFTITKGSGTEISYLWEGTQYSERVGGGILCLHSGVRLMSNMIIENTVNSAERVDYGGGVAALHLGSTAFIILQKNQISYNKLTADKEPACGGGLYLWCNAILRNNQIEYNSVVHNAATRQALAGGLACYSDPSDRREVIIESNKISYNSIVTYSDQEANTAFGGGVVIKGNEGRFSKNEVSHNEIWIKTGKNAVGGGIEIIQVADSFIIEGNIIRENAVNHGTGWGGGVGLYDCSPLIMNNIISGNSVTYGGGGFYITLSVRARLINNTIINNRALEKGGGLIVNNSSAAPVLLNTIIWNNQAPTGPAIQINNGTVHAAYCDIQGISWPGTGNFNLDPKLAADSLLYGSPCIDTGIESYDFGTGGICNCPATDINGRSRPLGKHPDIGAWESLPPVAVAEISNRISDAFALQQNYPNPFNPNTIIQYSLPGPGHVRLVIYDVMGRNIKTLMDTQQPAGQFQVTWDGTNEQNQAVAAGIYFGHFRVSATSTGSGGGAGQEFVKVIKLVLVK